MNRYWALVGGLVSLFFSTYLVVAASDINVFDDPSLERRGIGGVLGFALLVADSILPVASSLVMASLGALYGPVGGALVAIAGRVGAAAVGFSMGRRGGRLLVRSVPERERARADSLLTRWGALAVVLSRPVPILAETIVVMAGTTRLGWARVLAAAAVGSVPEAAVYATAGAVAASFGDIAVIWLSLLVLATFFWFCTCHIERRLGRVDPEAG